MGIWKLRDLAGWLHRERADKDRQGGAKQGGQAGEQKATDGLIQS